MKNTRIVFMGTPAFAANVLEALIKDGYNIVGVVTQMDKPVGRKKVLMPTPVKEVALAHNIPVFQPYRIRKEYDDILALEPELIITSAYGQIIPSAILDYPKYKCINTHGSLLPKYRGGAPIQWSIINGEKKTGITIMYMNEKMDEGAMLYQKELEIDIRDTNASLFEKLSDLTVSMMLEFLPKFLNGDFKAIEQDHSQATYAYNLKKEDEFIRFDRPVLEVYNHIRGLLDNPGAYCIMDKKKYKLKKVFFNEEVLGEENTLLGLSKEGLMIACIGGTLLVEEIQPEGKNVMAAKDFFNGSGKNLVGRHFEIELERVNDGSK